MSGIPPIPADDTFPKSQLVKYDHDSLARNHGTSLTAARRRLIAEHPYFEKFLVHKNCRFTAIVTSFIGKHLLVGSHEFIGKAVFEGGIEFEKETHGDNEIIFYHDVFFGGYITFLVPVVFQNDVHLISGKSHVHKCGDVFKGSAQFDGPFKTDGEPVFEQNVRFGNQANLATRVEFLPDSELCKEAIFYENAVFHGKAKFGAKYEAFFNIDTIFHGQRAHFGGNVEFIGSARCNGPMVFDGNVVFNGKVHFADQVVFRGKVTFWQGPKYEEFPYFTGSAETIEFWKETLLMEERARWN